MFCRWTVSRKSLPFLHLNFGLLLLGFSFLDTLNSASFGFFYLRNSRSPLQNSLDVWIFIHSLVFYSWSCLHSIIGTLDPLYGTLLDTWIFIHSLDFYSWICLYFILGTLDPSSELSLHFYTLWILLWDLFRFYTATSGAAAAGGTGLNPIHCGFIPVSPVLWLSPGMLRRLTVGSRPDVVSVQRTCLNCYRGGPGLRFAWQGLSLISLYFTHDS